MNQRLGCGALTLAFFLMFIGFGTDAPTVTVGYIGAAGSTMFIGIVAWMGMVSTRPDKQK